MALLFRLTILSLCVAGIFAASTGLGQEVEEEPPKAPVEPPKAPEEPTKAPEKPTKAPEEPTKPTEGPTPAPVPACSPGDRLADTQDCHKFTECKEGSWIQDKCFWFRKFDSITKKCVMWGATCAK